MDKVGTMDKSYNRKGLQYGSQLQFDRKLQVRSMAMNSNSMEGSMNNNPPSIPKGEIKNNLSEVLSKPKHGVPSIPNNSFNNKRNSYMMRPPGQNFGGQTI